MARPAVVTASGLFGLGGYRLIVRGESPSDAWDEFSAAAERGDYGAVWAASTPPRRPADG